MEFRVVLIISLTDGKITAHRQHPNLGRQRVAPSSPSVERQLVHIQTRPNVWNIMTHKVAICLAIAPNKTTQPRGVTTAADSGRLSSCHQMHGKICNRGREIQIVAFVAVGMWLQYDNVSLWGVSSSSYTPPDGEYPCMYLSQNILGFQFELSCLWWYLVSSGLIRWYQLPNKAGLPWMARLTF